MSRCDKILLINTSIKNNISPWKKEVGIEKTDRRLSKIHFENYIFSFLQSYCMQNEADRSMKTKQTALKMNPETKTPQRTKKKIKRFKHL